MYEALYSVPRARRPPQRLRDISEEKKKGKEAKTAKIANKQSKPKGIYLIIIKYLSSNTFDITH